MEVPGPAVIVLRAYRRGGTAKGGSAATGPADQLAATWRRDVIVTQKKYGGPGWQQRRCRDTLGVSPGAAPTPRPSRVHVAGRPPRPSTQVRDGGRRADGPRRSGLRRPPCGRNGGTGPEGAWLPLSHPISRRPCASTASRCPTRQRCASTATTARARLRVCGPGITNPGRGHGRRWCRRPFTPWPGTRPPAGTSPWTGPRHARVARPRAGWLAVAFANDRYAPPQARNLVPRGLAVRETPHLQHLSARGVGSARKRPCIGYPMRPGVP